MTALRLISLPLHGAAEMLTGTALMAAPFVLGLGPAATVLAVVLGALLVGLSLASVADSGGMPISAHHALDQALTIALLVAAVLLGLDGDRTGALVFAVVGIAQLALSVTTRYSRRPA